MGSRSAVRVTAAGVRVTRRWERGIRTDGPLRAEYICLDTVLPSGGVEEGCSEKRTAVRGDHQFESVSLRRRVSLLGAYGAVNSVSLYVERGRETFDAVHVEAAARVARLARESGVERLIHVSGIGSDPASSAPYIAARGRGEIAVQQAFPGATLIRPAVMCGPDDAFLTTVVRLLRILPVYPVFGRGETRLQPVYVEDVAEGIARVLSGAGGSVDSYEFAGARVYTYKELVRTVADRIRARPRLIPLPFALWRILASGAEFLPGSPLTRNQVALMQRDNIASADWPGLSSLDIAPTEIETLVSAVMDRS